MKAFPGLVVVVAACGLIVGAETARSAADEKTSTLAVPSVETPHLPNAHRVSARLISGAQPEGEQGFKDLQALGIKTIVSVDGAAPDVETAKKFGLRYVHLPISYGGVKEQEGKNLAKALSELPGPIYLHCHHGKHRSAAAVAVACVMNGTIRPEHAESILQTFGTGENYQGLWKAARDARPLDATALAAVKVDYVEIAKIPLLAERMVDIDKRWDALKSLQKNGWKPPADHPALDPADEALQLEEHLRETGRGADIAARAVAFHTMLATSENAAAALHKALSMPPFDAPAADVAFKAAAASCTACHKAYRD